MSDHEKDHGTPLRDSPDISGKPRSKTEQEFRRYDFDELSGGLDVVLITCGEEVYQLKQTRFRKLLLNK
jgi:hemin uptake protein HemP